MENMFSISFRKHRDAKKGNNSFTIITSISVSPSTYRNTVFNQSARVFSWGCFLKNLKMTERKCTIFKFAVILVPRAYDPSGLREESRALGATILK